MREQHFQRRCEERQRHPDPAWPARCAGLTLIVVVTFTPPPTTTAGIASRCDLCAPPLNLLIALLFHIKADIEGPVISAASLAPLYLTATDELLLAWHRDTNQLVRLLSFLFGPFGKVSQLFIIMSTSSGTQLRRQAWTWAASAAGEDAQIASVDANRTSDGGAVVVVGLTTAIAVLSEGGKAVGRRLLCPSEGRPQ